MYELCHSVVRMVCSSSEVKGWGGCSCGGRKSVVTFVALLLAAQRGTLWGGEGSSVGFGSEIPDTARADTHKAKSLGDIEQSQEQVHSVPALQFSY